MTWLAANFVAIGTWASVLGCVVGLPALAIALVQLARTKTAAEAAAATARQVSERIGRLLAVTSLEQICSRSRDLLHLVRARNLSGAATAALELREALAKFSRSRVAGQLLKPEAWTSLLEVARQVHDTFERAAAIRKIDGAQHQDSLRTIGTLHENLSMLTASASEKAGDMNANS